MTYKVIRDVIADCEIDDFARYAADYSESWAREQFARLNRVFTIELAEAPNTWNHFYIPRRAVPRVPVSRREAYGLLDRLQR